MQIILIQAEIEAAIRNYVNSKVKVAEGQDIRIDLAASRGPEGFRATIDIVDEETSAPVTPAPVSNPRAASTKAGSDNSDEHSSAKAKAAAEAEAKKKADAEAKAKADAARAAEESQAQAEKDAAASTEDSGATEGTTEPPFETDTEVGTASEAPVKEEAPAPRKPLFGRSNAALNA